VTHWSKHDDTLPEKGDPATGFPFTPRLQLVWRVSECAGRTSVDPL